MPTSKEITHADDKLATDSSASSLWSIDDKASVVSTDDTASIASTVKPSAPPKKATKSTEKVTKASPKWYNKFSSQPEIPGQETWRDASLPDKERWKQWQKAKDSERARGSTVGYYTTFYKEKGGWVWWLF